MSVTNRHKMGNKNDGCSQRIKSYKNTRHGTPDPPKYEPGRAPTKSDVAAFCTAENGTKAAPALSTLNIIFLALIDDYVFYYKQEKKAQAEVRKNGMTIKATSASGKEYDKENPAIKAAALFNKQKLTILRELDLRTDTVPPPDESGGNL